MGGTIWPKHLEKTLQPGLLIMHPSLIRSGGGGGPILEKTRCAVRLHFCGWRETAKTRWPMSSHLLILTPPPDTGTPEPHVLRRRRRPCRPAQPRLWRLRPGFGLACVVRCEWFFAGVGWDGGVLGRPATHPIPGKWAAGFRMNASQTQATSADLSNPWCGLLKPKFKPRAA